MEKTSIRDVLGVIKLFKSWAKDEGNLVIFVKPQKSRVEKTIIVSDITSNDLVGVEPSGMRISVNVRTPIVGARFESV